MPYFDHAATTPMLPESREAYLAATRSCGNASSQHNSGRRARQLIEDSRDLVADSFGAHSSEVVFTSGGTEGDNLAVQGIFRARRQADPRSTRIVTSAVEHPAVRNTVRWLERNERAAVTWLPVDSAGLVDVAAASEAMDDDVALVTVMFANNEVGTIQPIGELTRVAAGRGTPCHSDAVQAAGQLRIDFARSGLAAATVSGHKLGGPVGVGALLLARGAPCLPVFRGGGQERGLRPGTLDVAGIAAFAAAVQVTVRDLAARAQRVGKLRDLLVDRVLAAVPDAICNSPRDQRLPSHAHFSFPGCEGEALLLLLDAAGTDCSTGSACSAGVARPSHVLLAMGVDERLASSSIRFTLGHTSTVEDVMELTGILPEVVDRARRASTISTGRL